MQTSNTFYGLSRKDAERLVWRHTHRDFKSEGTGEKRLLARRNGHTLSVALVDLTEQELGERVGDSLRQIHGKAFRKQGLVVYPRRVEWSGAVDLDGRAYVVNLLTGDKRVVAEPSSHETQEVRMHIAFRESEAEASRLMAVSIAA